VHDRIVKPEELYFRDEAWLHVIGYLNIENNRDCISENPHLHEYPLHEIESWRPVYSYIQDSLANRLYCTYEGWNFNSSNYLFTTDTK